tara:strand:+ start:270 stop:509 length:240 start_codon:yes stop_codon:yes gene_type:complete
MTKQTKDMTIRQARQHLNEGQDYLLFSVVNDKIFVDYKNNASLNIVGDLAVANKDFASYLEEVLRAIKDQDNGKEKSTD